ncbi:hypothetical protein SESBI_38982 [Sesbania bispinosa]|nr:hypothetical protein SESBI_38982 [Sesbania bispinosa]
MKNNKWLEEAFISNKSSIARRNQDRARLGGNLLLLFVHVRGSLWVFLAILGNVKRGN